MSNEVTIPQLPNNISPPLTSLIEISNADVSQHTSLGNVLSQITGDALISINGVITISNNAISNPKIAANAVTTPKILDNNVTLAKLATGTAGNLISYAPSGQPVAVATGTAGQILTSRGAGLAPTFQTVSGTGGITSINNSMAAAQTFAANNGVTLADAGATHTFSIDTTTVATLTGTQNLTNKTLSTGTVFSAVPTINAGIKFTFSPNTTNAGINVGSFGGEPSSPNNGDLVYDSSANQLKAYIASNWVALGSGSGPAPTSLDDLTDVTITTAANTNVLIYDSSDSVWKNQTVSGDATITNTGVLAVSNNAISLAKLATGTAGNLISYDAMGDPEAVATGTAGQVLTSRGAGMSPSFASLPAVVAITSLNGLTGTTQTFSDGTGITVTSDGTAHSIAVNTGTVATLTGTQTLTNKTLSTGTVFSAVPTINAGIKFTFSPNTTNAGINVGSFGGEPSSPNNGDLVYDSSANQLKAYIASNWVALGDGGGTTPISLNELTDVIIDTVTAANVLIYDSTIPTPGWKNQTVSGDATISNTGVLAVSDNAISLAKLAPGTAGNLISYDAMGDPVAVETGTAGQILTSRGSALPPTFQDPSGTGGIVTINNDTTTAQTFNADTGLSITDNGATHTYGIDTTVVATLTGTQTLTNKTITAADNTLSIALSNLSNVTTTAPTDADILIYNNENTQWENPAMAGDATITNAGVLTISNSVIGDSNLASGVFTRITGIGTQSQTLNMNGQGIANIGILTSNTDDGGISTSGTIRFARTDTIGWRNEDNDGNLVLAVNDSNNLLFGTDPVVLETATQTLTNKTLTTPTIADFTNATHDHSNDTNGGNLTNSALTAGTFSSITGIGTQTQDLNMGEQSISNVDSLQSDTTDPAVTGVIRVANTDIGIAWRNEANSGDLPLAVNTSNALMFNAIVIATVSGTQTLTNKTLSTNTVFSAAPTINDGTKFTFSPTATNAGINVGSIAGNANPTTPIAGDLYYNSTDNELRAYIGSAWISLGAAGGATSLNELSDVTIDTPVENDILIYNSSSSIPRGWNNQSVSGDATITNTGVFTISNNVIDNANLVSGTFAKITGIGAQSQTLNMNAQSIQGVLYLQSNTTNPAADSGIIRLARIDTIEWRDQANDDNLTLNINADDNLRFNDDPVVLETATQTLTNKTITAADNSLSIALTDLSNVTSTTPVNRDILIYDGTQWRDQTMTGDAIITNTGVFTISNNAISLAKLATGTAGNLISYDAMGDPEAVATGTAGQILTSRGPGLAPTFQSLTVAGGTGITVTTSNMTYTVNIDNSVATLSGIQTLTNKTITAADNTLSIALSDLSNVTIDTAADTNILIYDGLSTPTAWKNRTLSGDATITNTGVLAVSNNAISLAKLATGTAGNLISYDAMGDPEAVATGDAGQVLTSRGAGMSPSFASLPAVVAITSLNGLTGTTQTFANGTGITVTSEGTAHSIAVNTGTVATLTGTQTLTNKTLSTGTVFSAAPTINDGTKFTFSPTATNAGINVGSITGNANPTTPTGGDLYYNSTNNELRAYIGSAWISLGAAGGATSLNELSDVTIDTPVENDILIYNSSSSIPRGWNNQSVSGDATISNTGVFTISNNVIDNANLSSGTFAKITGIGAQSQTLNMNGQFIQGVSYLQSNTANPAADSGIIRLARIDTIEWRDQANDDNLTLNINADDNLRFNDDPVVLETATQTLTNKTITAADNSLSIALTDLSNVTSTTPVNRDILIYDGTQWRDQTMTGDAIITNTGALTISNNAISLAKLATGTAGNLISYAPSGQPVAVATGTAGQILTSNGVGLAPTFQDASGTGGITSLNGLTGEVQTFANGTGITVTSEGTAHTIAVNTTTVATLTGTQTLTNKTLTTPTIADFTNATHDHSNDTNGGNLTNSALTAGTFSSITGIGAQSQALNMNAQAIQGVTFLQSNTVNTALSGVIRLARADEIVWRNEADAGNLQLAVNTTNNLVFEADPVVLAAAAQTLTNKTFSTGTTFSAAPTINDGTKFTFSPNGTNPGLNVGSHTADPSTSEDGDVYYNSTDNELKIRVNNDWKTVNTSQMTVNFSNGTYSHPNGTAENTVLTVTTNQDRTTVSYDMSTLTQNTVIRVKEEVDGTTEEIISEKTWPTDFAANIQAAEIELIGKNRDQTITFQSETAEGAIRAIPFARRDDVVE